MSVTKPKLEPGSSQTHLLTCWSIFGPVETLGQWTTEPLWFLGPLLELASGLLRDHLYLD
jgi:hypothetical protein